MPGAQGGSWRAHCLSSMLDFSTSALHVLRRSIPVCQHAMNKFFELHSLQPAITSIDQTAVYFCLPTTVTLDSAWYSDFNAKRSP